MKGSGLSEQGPSIGCAHQAAVTLRVGNSGAASDLVLADFHTLPDWVEELGAILESGTKRDYRIEFLPPISPGLSLRSAFSSVVRIWLALDEAWRPSLECVVASEAVRESLASLLPGRRAEAVFRFGHLQLAVVVGDITAIEADAIVNASNTHLWLGGGVSYAIRMACGPGLQSEMSAISSRRLLDDGDAAITGSHGLATARHIIHAASAAGDAGTVARSIQNVLRLSIERKFGNVATPALGTGTGGMEMATFARLLATELRRHCESGAEFPKLLRLVAYRNRDAETVTATLRDLGVSPL